MVLTYPMFTLIWVRVYQQSIYINVYGLDFSNVDSDWVSIVYWMLLVNKDYGQLIKLIQF
jgi:hypothetical protein